MREFATGAPRFIVHTYTHRIVRIRVYMGDIKAIDAKHFATGLRIAPTTQTHKCAHMCVCVWVRVDLARIGMIAEFSTLRFFLPHTHNKYVRKEGFIYGE